MLYTPVYGAVSKIQLYDEAHVTAGRIASICGCFMEIITAMIISVNLRRGDKVSSFKKGVEILSDDPVPGRRSVDCEDNLSTHHLSEVHLLQHVEICPSVMCEKNHIIHSLHNLQR